MPFSRLYRRDAPLADSDFKFDSNMTYNPNQWHEQELDFTTYSDLNQTTQLSNPTSMEADNPNTYPRNASMKPAADGSLPIAMFTTGPFSYPDLINMDSSNTVSPLDISSSSSVRTDSVAGLESGCSPAFSATTGSALPTLQEKMCPLISGDTDVCEPSRCGPDAPCMNFTTLAPIEECASIPCMSPPSEDSPPTRSSTRPQRLANKRSVTQMSTPSDDRRTTATARKAQATQKAARANAGDRANSGQLTKMDKKQRAKQAHSLVEKKYRENINTKLSLLHTTLINAQHGTRRFTDPDSDCEIDDDYDNDMPKQSKDSAMAPKFRKSEVLDDAMNYVNQTEVEMRHMETEILRLSEKVQTLEKLVKCEDCSLLKRMVHMQVQQPA